MWIDVFIVMVLIWVCFFIASYIWRDKAIFPLLAGIVSFICGISSFTLTQPVATATGIVWANYGGAYALSYLFLGLGCIMFIYTIVKSFNVMGAKNESF